MDLIISLTTVAVSVGCGILAAYWVFDTEMNRMDTRLRELEKESHSRNLDSAIYDIETENWQPLER